MIQINLLKSQQASGAAPLVGRREAILGAAMLALACVALFYLSTRSGGGRTGLSKPAAAPATSAVATVSDPETPAGAPAPAAPVRVEPASAPPAAPAAAAPVPAASGCSVTGVSFAPQSGALVVSVRTTTAAKSRSFELDQPNRLVIDLPDCQLAVPPEQYSQRTGRPSVERVRVSLFQSSPPVVRVVLDVAGKPRHEIQSRPDGLEVVILENAP